MLRKNKAGHAGCYFTAQTRQTDDLRSRRYVKNT
jgi:hypothetical protein